MKQSEIATYILNILFFIVNLGILFFNGYFKRKGENLATKQDIQQITDKVESVKIEYLRQIEEYKKDLEIKYSFEPTILKAKISLYELSVHLLQMIIKRKNNLADEATLNQQIFSGILQMLITINSHLKLKGLLKDESTILQEERNNIMTYINKQKEEGKETYEFKIDMIIKALNDIQEKIVQ